MFAHELKLYRVHNESGYVCMYVCIMLITLPSCMCIEDNQCTHRKRMTKTIKNALKQILKMANEYLDLNALWMWDYITTWY